MHDESRSETDPHASWERVRGAGIAGTRSFAWGLLLLITALTVAACAGSWSNQVIEEVTQAEQRYAELEGAGDVEAQFDLMADDYVYIDVSGKRIGKEELMARRAGDERRSSELELSDLEVLPIAPDAALTRGRWDSRSLYYGGLPRVSASRYMALWRKRDGRWLLVADQTTPIAERSTVVRERVGLAAERLAALAGRYRLETAEPLEVELEATADALALAIPGHLDEPLAFFPSAPDRFFSVERPWELEFGSDGEEIVLATWGEPTRGRRVRP